MQNPYPHLLSLTEKVLDQDIRACLEEHQRYINPDYQPTKVTYEEHSNNRVQALELFNEISDIFWSASKHTLSEKFSELHVDEFPDLKRHKAYLKVLLVGRDQLLDMKSNKKYNKAFLSDLIAWLALPLDQMLEKKQKMINVYQKKDAKSTLIKTVRTIERNHPSLFRAHQDFFEICYVLRRNNQAAQEAEGETPLYQSWWFWLGVFFFVRMILKAFSS